MSSSEYWQELIDALNRLALIPGDVQVVELTKQFHQDINTLRKFGF